MVHQRNSLGQSCSTDNVQCFLQWEFWLQARSTTWIPHPLIQTPASASPTSTAHFTDDVGGGLSESSYIRNDAGTIIHISHPLTHRHHHLIPIVLMMLEVVLVRVPISKMMLAQLSTSHINSVTYRHQHHFDGWTDEAEGVFFLESSDGTVTGINFILIAWYTDDNEGVLFGEKRNDGGTIIHITTDSFSHTYARTHSHTCIALMALYWHCWKWFPCWQFLTHICTDSHTHALISITLMAWSYWYRWKKSSWWDFWPTSTKTQLHTHTSLQARSQTHASASLWWSSRIWRCWVSSCWRFQHTSAQTHWVIRPRASPHTHQHHFVGPVVLIMLKVFFLVSVPTAEMMVARVPVAEVVRFGAVPPLPRCGWDGKPGGRASHLLFRFFSSVNEHTHKNSCHATRKTKRLLGQKTWWKGVPLVLPLLLVWKWPCTQISCTVVMLPERQNAKNATIVVFNSLTEKHSSLHRHRNMCQLHTSELRQSCCHFSHEDSSGFEDD